MKTLIGVLIGIVLFAVTVFAQSPEIYSSDGKYLGNLNSKVRQGW